MSAREKQTGWTADELLDAPEDGAVAVGAGNCYAGSKVINSSQTASKLRRLLLVHGEDALEYVIRYGEQNDLSAAWIRDVLNRKKGDRRTEKRLHALADIIRSVDYMLSSRKTAIGARESNNPEPEHQDPPKKSDRPWPHCYTTSEMATILNGTRTQTAKWVERKCPDKWKIKHCGSWYVHSDAMPQARQYAISYGWDGERRWSVPGSNEKPVASDDAPAVVVPPPCEPMATASPRLARNGFWRRLSLAWRMFRSSAYSCEKGA